MAAKPDPNHQTRLDMANARKQTTIEVDTIRDFLHDGHLKWKKHSSVVNVLSNDPVFDKSRRHFMTRTERYNRTITMTNRIYELQGIHNWSGHETDIATNLLDEPIPMSLHAIAFEPVFNLQASPELVAKYRQLIAHRGILGCYLQTELGHGTNVSQLETTATYIPQTQEFEIHSPTLTSRKWWIGALGKTSTHGVVQAKLILPGGRDMGPHLFFIQLRSLKDHTVLPRITVGDIGPKTMNGYSPTDHGFAVFDHVRIPKHSMLSKFAQVTNEGEYIKPPHAKLSYGGMLYIRSTMITGGGWLMAKAVTVSIRYATVRRQGNKGPDGLERQVISYPSTYYRLLPILSHAYVFISLGRTMAKNFEKFSAQLASGDTSQLAEVHALSSGLKILVTTTGIQDLEIARRSMGGHGYSALSGLGRLYADYLPSATYEGDNFVLDQQVVRAALKALNNLVSSENPFPSSLAPSSFYLRFLLQPNQASGDNDSWKDPTAAISLLERRAAYIVQERARNQSNPDAGVDQRVSKAVTEAYVAARVGELINDLPVPKKDKAVVGNLLQLYLLTTVEAGLADILSFGLLVSGPSTGADITRSLRIAIADLCRELLPNAIGLSDAFGFTDWELDSALGVYEGNVYEKLYEGALAEPLNKSEVPDAYEHQIKPMLERGQRLAAKSKL